MVNKCLYCGKDSGYKRFCNNRCKNEYFKIKHNDSLLAEDPEKVVKEILKEVPAAKKDYLEEVKIRRIVPRGRFISLKISGGEWKWLGVKPGDVIDIQVKVVMRSTEEPKDATW